MNYLNLGCGHRFHSAWTNLDFTATDTAVIAQDLTQGIPFPDASFELVYHSHLLEHFSKPAAESFLKECWRVLQPQGILRVVVPDLEQIARLYLTAVEHASGGCEEWNAHYDWMLLEMYDQTVRHYSGGEMAAYLSRKPIPGKEFILKRYGLEAKNLMAEMSQQPAHAQSAAVPPSWKGSLRQAYYWFRYPNYRREGLLKLLLGEEYRALQVGRFRLGGEVHQWMYDRYSLARLLKQCGFEQIVQCAADESHIPNWTSFNLDTEPDGTVYKPDSLFMEARKPVA